MNWLCSKLLVVCQQISSVSYGFWDKLDRKRPKVLISKFWYFDFHLFFWWNSHLFNFWWVSKENELFLNGKGAKRSQFPKFPVFLKECTIYIFLLILMCVFLWIDCDKDLYPISVMIFKFKLIKVKLRNHLLTCCCHIMLHPL